MLDGEMICLDENNTPCWEDVCARLNTSKADSIKRLSQTKPCLFMAFDALLVDGRDITRKPLIERIEHLNKVVVPSDHIAVVDNYSDGEQLFQATKKLQLEGIVSKKKGSIYTCNARPQNTWYKIKNYTYDIVEVAGIRKNSFGWLLTQDYGNKYVGVCEFVPPQERVAFSRISKQLIKKEDKNYIYLDPLIRCQIKFQGRTKNGHPRTPSFVKFVFD
ncbi:DNA ligase-1 [Ammoniphilus resinae]|uniref:DNA ligase-1 n=1 Tax=Ammoniphilus resinae TaxID=861532 RepID=A0ABS4GP47_9BACL|nr:DNA ligase-1 [Ammoniphilus resinae]